MPEDWGGSAAFLITPAISTHYFNIDTAASMQVQYEKNGSGTLKTILPDNIKEICPVKIHKPELRNEVPEA